MPRRAAESPGSAALSLGHGRCGEHPAIYRENLMKRFASTGALLGCATLFALAASAPVGAQGQQQTLVIQGGTLIDGNGGAPVANATVIIQGNRITQVGRGLRAPAGAQVIDANGKYI